MTGKPALDVVESGIRALRGGHRMLVQDAVTPAKSVAPSVGLYYPMPGNSTLPDGSTLRDQRFGVGIVRMIADPGYGGWPWAQGMAELCSTSGQVFACILPPSEGALENNPADNVRSLRHP